MLSFYEEPASVRTRLYTEFKIISINCPKWKELTAYHKREILNKYQKSALQKYVDISERGGFATNGIKLRTFYHYMVLIKKALIYDVSVEEAYSKSIYKLDPEQIALMKSIQARSEGEHYNPRTNQS